jgi:hypothetical protein
VLSIPKINYVSLTKKFEKELKVFELRYLEMMIKKHDILEKLASVRSELTRKHNKPMGNLQVIEALFDKWFGETDNRNTDVPVCPSTYVRAKKTDCNQSVLLIAEDSFHRLLEVSEWHARQCKDNLQSTKIVKKDM